MKRVLFVCFLVVGVGLTLSLLADNNVQEGAAKLDSFVCTADKIEFDDGDSFKCNGENIRVLGVDTPEIIHEEHGIFEDQKMGREAAAFTKKLLSEADRIVIIRGGKDVYGRTLAHVMVDGELLSVTLIKKGFGYETISRYGNNGFPLFAAEIADAATGVPRPKFDDPYEWRAKNQRKDNSSMVKR